MEKIIKRYIDAFQHAKLLHKVLFFLPALIFALSLLVVIYLYFDLTKDLYNMYKYKHLSFLFYILWFPITFILLFLSYVTLSMEIDLDLFITKNIKEVIILSIVLPIITIVGSSFVLMFAMSLPYIIIEYWNVSKIFFLILLLGLILFGIYIFISSNNEDTIGRYAFTIIILGVFVIYPFSRSDTYNQFMAEYYLKSKDYSEAIDYLKFLALESDDDYIREESANLVINLYLKDDYKGSAVSFAHKVNDISDYANYIIGMDELESENLTSATYYLYRASDSYAYKDVYNELQEAIKERGRKLLHDIFIPEDIFDLIPIKKIFKGAKILKRISKGSNIGKIIYKNRMTRTINSSKEQIKEFEKCIRYKSYEDCKYKLPN